MRRLIRLLVHRGNAERITRDVDREIELHLDLRAEELKGLGLTTGEARVEALRTFGDVSSVAAECRTVRTQHLHRQSRADAMGSMLQDLRFAVRMLRRSPGFTLVAVMTLALGIGANTAIVGAVNAVLLRPLPFANADRLVSPAFEPRSSVSKGTFVAIHGQAPAFDDIAVYSRWGYSLTGSGEPEVLTGAASSANLFTVLGRSALVGRALREGDDRPGGERVAVISSGLWHRRFGGDPRMIGKPITLNGIPHTVVGVMPPDFAFPVPSSDLWTAVTIDPADAGDFAAGYLLMVGRLRPGTSLEAARLQLRALAARLHANDPKSYSERYGRESDVRPLREATTRQVEPALLVLLGAVGFVLLIACANVANLLLARAVVREREIALRVALGAARRRVVRQLLTESALLALVGAALGIVLAYVLVRIASGALPPALVEAGGVSVDARVLALTVLLALVVGIGFGLVPALAAVRRDAFGALRAEGRSHSAGVRGRRTMNVLVVSEVALALVLTIGAGLMLRSFLRLRAEQPGFRTEGILAASLVPPEAQYAEPSRRRAMLAAVTERVRALPGVTSVGAIHLLPFGGSNWNPELVIEHRALAPGAERPSVDWRVVTPEYFQTLGVPVIRGRAFTSADLDGALPVAVVNATLARTQFPGEEPIGRRVRTFFEGADGWVTIVGVVADTKDQTLAAPANAQMYRPFAQYTLTGMVLMVRTTLDPTSLAPALRRAVWSVDRNVPIDRLEPLQAIVLNSVATQRLAVLLLGAFGALALLLGGVGIYGVMSYAVAQRSRDIGVRLALGALPGEVLRLVVRDALTLATIGLALGVVASLALTRVLEGQLHDVAATDLPTFLAAVAMLGVIALAAAIVPGWRASRLDPALTLKGEG